MDCAFLWCCRRQHADLLSAARIRLELHVTVDQGEDREISAHADVLTRMEPGAALAHQHVAGLHQLAVEALDAPTLRVAVAPVAGAADTLLMSHSCLSLAWE